MTDASWTWIVESGEPDEPGWYAVVMCWDASEGMFPDASKWTGSKWDELTRGIAAFHGPFVSRDLALSWARANDPDY